MTKNESKFFSKLADLLEDHDATIEPDSAEELNVFFHKTQESYSFDDLDEGNARFTASNIKAHVKLNAKKKK